MIDRYAMYNIYYMYVNISSYESEISPVSPVQHRTSELLELLQLVGLHRPALPCRLDEPPEPLEIGTPIEQPSFGGENL